jgi:hypothetical protein
MCRNIKTLANFEPPATDEEIRASALQFVRKLSGMNKPSKANEPVFNQALEEVTEAARRLVRSLRVSSSPRNRDVEKEKAKLRGMRRGGGTPTMPSSFGAEG